MTCLVFKVNQLGDNVIFLPVVQSLIRTPGITRVVVVTSPVAEPLYRVACPQAEVLTYETNQFNGAWRRPWQLPAMIRQIRAFKPDACLLGDDQSNVAHLLGRVNGAIAVGPLVPERLFKRRVRVPGRWFGGLLHQRVTLHAEDSVAVQNWHIAEAFVAKMKLPALPDAGPPPPDLSAFGTEDHGCVLIHAGASRAYKRWPMESYVALANRLCTGHPVMWIAQDAVEEAGLSSAVTRVSTGSLAQFIRLMAGARFFIGNNSGPMNIASALGIPGLIFNGPSRSNWDPVWHRERFDLLRDPELACQPCDHFTHPVNVCLNEEHPMTCMDRWTLDVVHARVLARLAASSSPPPDGARSRSDDSLSALISQVDSE